MEIEVLGTGCAKCKSTCDLFQRTAQEAGKTVIIDKVEDMRQIVGFGVTTTPAVVVAGKAVHKGSAPSREQVLGLLSSEAAR